MKLFLEFFHQILNRFFNPQKNEYQVTQHHDLYDEQYPDYPNKGCIFDQRLFRPTNLNHFIIY